MAGRLTVLFLTHPLIALALFTTGARRTDPLPATAKGQS